MRDRMRRRAAPRPHTHQAGIDRAISSTHAERQAGKPREDERGSESPAFVLSGCCFVPRPRGGPRWATRHGSPRSFAEISSCNPCLSLCLYPHTRRREAGRGNRAPAPSIRCPPYHTLSRAWLASPHLPPPLIIIEPQASHPYDPYDRAKRAGHSVPPAPPHLISLPTVILLVCTHNISSLSLSSNPLLQPGPQAQF